MAAPWGGMEGVPWISTFRFSSSPSSLFRFRSSPYCSPVKAEPYECGVKAPTTAFDTRFSIRYYLIAVLFVVFDVETIFMFPWAVSFDRLALFGFIEMVVFLAILVVGYVYAWRRGALEWA